ncbi:Hypothetical predicted protein [Paramuricea clavata]|uniref:Uncharacterized protein n=1 Tax=Paramuricea clavata TaxID=317549 RepID=A0A6S7JCG1_PARCT|nr:Hypothetical predicted protein [Paramuricea clavata]
MNAQGGEKVAGYTQECINLEYKSIDNAELVKTVESQFDTGRTLLNMLVCRRRWNGTEIQRSSMKPSTFRGKNIDKIKVIIEGVPNYVYSQGIPKARLFKEAEKVYVDRATAGMRVKHTSQTLTDHKRKYLIYVLKNCVFVFFLESIESS